MSKEQIEELQANPFYNKYAEKIAKLQKNSPEQFLNRLAEAEEKKKQSKSAAESTSKDFSLPTKAKSSSNPKMIKEKKLDEKMKMDLLKDKSKEEIAEIWRQYHKTKDAVSAVIPASTFKQMEQRFGEFSMFLFPLPRKEGYEFVVVQFEGKKAHFTTLINYQAHKENAPECLTLVHYTDLAEEKGIVLMSGDYDKNLLTVQEAQCLCNCVEVYYCNPSAESLNLLEAFTKKPESFKHMDLISQFETISFLSSQPVEERSYSESKSKKNE